MPAKDISDVDWEEFLLPSSDLLHVDPDIARSLPVIFNGLTYANPRLREPATAFFLNDVHVFMPSAIPALIPFLFDLTQETSDDGTEDILVIIVWYADFPDSLGDSQTPFAEEVRSQILASENQLHWLRRSSTGSVRYLCNRILKSAHLGDW